MFAGLLAESETVLTVELRQITEPDYELVVVAIIDCLDEDDAERVRLAGYFTAGGPEALIRDYGPLPMAW